MPVRKLEYPTKEPEDEHTSLIPGSQRIASPGAGSGGHEGRFFEHVAEGIQQRDRALLQKEIVRYGSFIWAIISCLCAGSITAFSLYGHMFQERLRFTQYQVNIVSICAIIALYLPVPLLGYMSDRFGPRPASILSAVLFGVGYFIAAFAYKSGPPAEAGGSGWPVWVMALGFIFIGSGTAAMYIANVTTCAKNFGKGKHKGLALSAPIAAFGLGGMWQSQVGTHLIYETLPDGSRGDVDVHRYFLFLAGLLIGIGLADSFLLRIVGEEELIDEAIDTLERSGLLDGSEFFERRGRSGYGTLHDVRRPSQASLDLAAEETEQARKKAWLLNAETKSFLLDKTVWWLAGGFFLVSGAGDSYINNVGTIIPTLSPAMQRSGHEVPSTSAATHVSIIAVTSTLSRVLFGLLSDLVAPAAEAHQHRRGYATSVSSSISSLDPMPATRQPFSISRMTLLLFSTLVMSGGQVLLASGAVQDHAASRFWIVSSLIGAGYGAVFSLVPIVISVVYGVEGFGTHWGIVAVVPAVGAALWGVIYATVYENGTKGGTEAGVCHGAQCYSITFWAMAASAWVACLMWLWAWRGIGGWTKRGIVV
ncbi:hypothetical protein MRB53_037165 [Persea americana]|nr:hypothetical protein MRB53_037165 [Persea americana]